MTKPLRLIQTGLLWTISACCLAASADKTARVVSIDGGLTEIIYALDLEDLLVGVDTTSTWPAAATKLPQVGYLRALSAEGLLSLNPTLIVTSSEAGPAEALQQISDSGIALTVLERDHTVEGLMDRVLRVAELFDVPERGRALAAKIDRESRRAMHSGGDRPGVLFLLGTEAGSAMAAGSDTSANAMIGYAGGDNLFDEHDGYKPLSTESLIASAPDVIIAVSHGQGADGDVVDAVLALPGVSMTPAGKQRRIVVADGVKMLGFGPRVGEAIAELSAALHR